MPSNRYAAIDLGSNSSLLLIAEVPPEGEIVVLEDRRATARLSTRVQQGVEISEASISFLFTVLDRFKELIDSHEVRQVAACGTQVFRVALNGHELAGRIRDRYGWGVEIISGEEEGRLSYLAAATGLPQVEENRIVIDVGGASSEVILGRKTEILFQNSFPLGAVSLTERCRLQNAISESDAEAAKRLIAELIPLGKLPPRDVQCMNTAVGGTASSLAAIFLKAAVFDPNQIHGVTLTREWIVQTTMSLRRMTLTSRREIMSFDPERAEIIVGGAMILKYLLDTLKINKITVSNRGLRWGLLVDRFGLQNRF